MLNGDWAKFTIFIHILINHLLFKINIIISLVNNYYEKMYGVSPVFSTTKEDKIIQILSSSVIILFYGFYSKKNFILP